MTEQPDITTPSAAPGKPAVPKPPPPPELGATKDPIKNPVEKPWHQSVWLAGTLLVIAIVIVYSNSLSTPFVYDDISGIVQNPDLRTISITDLFTGQTPVSAMLMKLNYAACRLNVVGWHIVNIMLHAAAALALMGVVRRTLMTPRLRGRFGDAATPLAFATALLWSLHPLQTEAVTYIIQRKESLVSLFYLLTAYCFIRGEESPNRRFWGAATVIACLLGMGSKQIMVTAPIIVLLYDRAFISGGFKQAIRRNWPMYVALAATWAYVVAGSVGRMSVEGLGTAEVTRWQYARTQPEVILHYLRLIVWPTNLVLDYNWPVAKPETVLLPALVLLALLIVTLVALWRWPGWGFLGAWFFGILGPTSSVIVIATVLAYEHRLYLPLAGPAALVVIGGYLLWKRIAGGRAACDGRITPLVWAPPAVALAAIAITLGALTFVRNYDYRSALVVWQDVVSKAPWNARARAQYAIQLEQIDKRDKAMAEFNEALRLKPNYPEVYSNLGVMHHKQGLHDLAMKELTKAIEQDPTKPECYLNRAAAYKSKGQLDQAVADCTTAIEKMLEAKRPRPEYYVVRAGIYKTRGDREHALADYTAAIEVNPRWPDGYLRRGDAFASWNEHAKALADFSKAIELAPRAPDAYAARAQEYLAISDYSRAWDDVHDCQARGGSLPPAFIKKLSAASGRSE